MKDAASILLQTQATYEGLSSYADIGEIVRNPSIKNCCVGFKTFFVRPSKIRFEWDGHPYFDKGEPPDKGGLLLSNGSDTGVFYLNQHKRFSEAVTAIYAVKGVSSGSVHRILGLLLNELENVRARWCDMPELQLLNDEVVSGILCHHIVGRSRESALFEIWIDRGTFMVRKIRETVNRSTKQNEKLHAEALAMLQCVDIEQEELPTYAEQFTPSNYYHDYNYTQVIVNQPIPAELFQVADS